MKYKSIFAISYRSVFCVQRELFTHLIESLQQAGWEVIFTSYIHPNSNEAKLMIEDAKSLGGLQSVCTNGCAKKRILQGLDIDVDIWAENHVHGIFKDLNDEEQADHLEKIDQMKLKESHCIGLDFDETYDLEPEVFFNFSEWAAKDKHDIRIVTARMGSLFHEDNQDINKVFKKHKRRVKVMFSKRKAKMKFLMNNRRTDFMPDFWIDDSPEWIIRDITSNKFDAYGRY